MADLPRGFSGGSDLWDGPLGNSVFFEELVERSGLPVDRRVRYKRVTDTGTTRTITYDEPTPLDNTHVHVLIITASSTTAITTPSGWIAISGNGNNGNSQLRCYYRYADGTVNSVTVTTPNVAIQAELMAFKGYLRPEVMPVGGVNIPSGSSFVIDPTISWTPPNQYGVMIMAARLLTSPSSWNDPVSDTGSTEFNGITPGLLLQSSRREVLPSDTNLRTTFSWVGSIAGRAMSFFIPLQPDDGPNGLILSDDFNRDTDISLGFGMPDFGPKWHNPNIGSGNNGAYSEDATDSGRIFQTNVGQSGTRNFPIYGPQANEIFLSYGISLNVVPVGASTSPRVGANVSDASGLDIHTRWDFGTSGAVTIRTARADAAYLSGGAYTIPDYTYVADDVIRCKWWLTQESGQIRVRTKIWVDGTPEPADWGMNQTDTTSGVVGKPMRLFVNAHRLLAFSATPLITSFKKVRVYNQEPILTLPNWRGASPILSVYKGVTSILELFKGNP